MTVEKHKALPAAAKIYSTAQGQGMKAVPRSEGLRYEALNEEYKRTARY
jgi:hypothetical protein